MKSYVILKNEQEDPLPPNVAGPDVRYTESLVRHFLNEFTREDDVVFDPFAGFGTTLKVAQDMSRDPFGVEINPQRLGYARSRLQRPEQLVAGDVRQLALYPMPAFQFSLSSPPYMGRGHLEDPLTDYSVEGEGYERYLSDLQAIYRQVGSRMTEGGHIVIEVSNLKGPDGVTTLAWDIAREVSQVLSFQGEVVIGWEGSYGYGYDHSYCLLFTA